MRSEVHPPDLAPALRDLMEAWEIPLTIVDQPIRKLSAPRRRAQLFSLFPQKTGSPPPAMPRKRDTNAVALGHHMDDILQTLLMNMVWQGETAAMPPLLDYGDGLKIIRPLCLIQEHHIETFVARDGLDRPGQTLPLPGRNKARRRPPLSWKPSPGAGTV